MRNAEELKAYRRAYYLANKDRLYAQKRLRGKSPSEVAWRAKYTADGGSKANYRANLPRGLWANAKRRAAERGLEFTITKEDVHIPDICPVLGIPLAVGNGTAQSNSASLDRIDNSLGYIPGNVQVISLRANAMKNSATQEELLKFAYWCTTSFGYSRAAV